MTKQEEENIKDLLSSFIYKQLGSDVYLDETILVSGKEGMEHSNHSFEESVYFNFEHSELYDMFNGYGIDDFLDDFEEFCTNHDLKYEFGESWEINITNL